MKKLQQLLTSGLAPKGFDIVHPVNVLQYNLSVPPEFQITDEQKRVPNQPTVAFFIGNTKTLWSPLVHYYRDLSSPSLPDDPVNVYTEKMIEEQVAKLDRDSTPGLRCYWAHNTTPGEMIAIQKMICSSNYATLCPHSHLCIHPRYHSWFAIRAILYFPHLVYDEAPTKVVSAVQYSDAAEERIKVRMKEALDDSKDWKKWLDVRLALAPDHPERYGKSQMLYHYHHLASPGIRHEILRQAMNTSSLTTEDQLWTSLYLKDR